MMQFIEIETLEIGSTGTIIIEIILFIVIEKIELTGDHIEIMLFIEIEKFELDSMAAILKLCYLLRSKH